MDLGHLKNLMNLGHLNLPKLRIDRNPNVDDFATKLYRQYSDYINHEDKGKEIVEQLEKDSRVQALEDRMISRGFGSSQFQIQDLAMWYSWAINEFGPEIAEKNLNTFLESEMVAVVNALWILGVELKSSIALDNGIEIVPIDEMPDSRQKNDFEKIEFNSLGCRQLKPKAAITIKSKVLKSSPCDTFEIPEKDMPFMESGRLLNDVSLLLNAVEGVSCTPFCSESYTLPDMPFGMFAGGGGGYRRHDIIGRQFSKLSVSSLNEINTLLTSFNKLSPQKKEQISRVLSRLSQAKRREQIEDKILDLAIALEMVLLENNKDQLSLTFRLRGSWLIGKNYEERKMVNSQLKEIYNFRSQVAHNGVLKGDERKIKKIRDDFPEYSNLAEKIIAQVIHQSNPDWSKMILGGA